MKTIRHFKHFFLSISLLLSTTTFFWTTTFSFKAKADASCNVLLSDLSQYLNSSYYNRVTLIHMTNYQANNQWFGGYTQASLSKNYNGHLIGSDNRLLSSRIITLSNNNTGFDFGRSQPFDVLQPDPISYDIDPQTATIVFDNQYGPYDITCVGNKFAIVNSGDSIETFSFTKSAVPIIR